VPRKLNRNFFKQKGRILNPLGETIAYNTAIPREVIATLSNVKPTKTQLIWQYATVISRRLQINTSRRSIYTHARWAGASLALSLVFASFLFGVPVFKQKQAVPNKYSLYSSIPLTLDSVSQDLDYSDSRSVRIDKVMQVFNCPMKGLGETFVKEADNNDIPYWVVAAIAFQESSCGKNTPIIDGAKTYNAWGWATYGEKVYQFDSFEQGIDVVSQYLSKKFYSRGVTDLCEIMKIYTPPSNGSWCKGVEYFGDFIQSYKSPSG